MKTFKPLLSETVLAAADLAKNLFIDAVGAVCGANKKALGVTEIDTKSGEYAGVVTHGIALVLSGGAITVTDEPVAVASDAAGKAVAATAFSVAVPAGATPVTSDGAQPNLTEAGGVLPQAINGYALDSASGANELIRVLLR